MGRGGTELPNEGKINMPDQISFPVFFMRTMLNNAGWPKEEGRFRKKLVVNSFLVNITMSQLNRFGVILGFSSPEIALRFLTQAFSTRDWANTSVNFFKDEFVPAFDASGNGDIPAWEALNSLSGIRPHSVKQAEQTIPWEFLADEKMEMSYTLGFLRSITWALIHPTEAKIQLTDELEETISVAEEAEQHGLEFNGELPTAVTDWAAQTHEIVAAFEAETGSLPEIEHSLLTLPEFSIRVKH